MLTYVADVFGHALVEPPFFWRKIKVQRGLFFCKVGIYYKSQKIILNIVSVYLSTTVSIYLSAIACR